MAARTSAAPNPLARVARNVPELPALAASIVARLTGAAAVLYYAYDQDTLFPGRHFPRTWTFAIVIAGIALLSLVPWARVATRRPGLATWASALGCGVLVFGGANLAQQPAGVVALAAGVLAWLAFAAASSRRPGAAGANVSGLLSGSLVSFVTVGGCVLLIGG